MNDKLFLIPLGEDAILVSNSKRVKMIKQLFDSGQCSSAKECVEKLGEIVNGTVPTITKLVP